MRFNFPVILVPAICFSLLTSISNSSWGQDAEQKATTVSVFDKGELSVPAEFKKVQPKSRIIQHEFEVKSGDETARLTFMPAGGGVEPNIKRWKGQFSGGKAEDQKTEKLDLGEWEVHLVDVSGSFAERMGGGPFAGGKMVQREDYAMTGAIFVAPNGGLYFAKMVGPAEVIKANREKFVAMAKSIGDK